MQTKLKSIKLVDGSPVVRMTLSSDEQDQTKTTIEMRVTLPPGGLQGRSVEESDVLTMDLVRKAIGAYAGGRPFDWR